MSIWKRLQKYKDMDVEKEEEEKMSDLEKGDLFSMIISALLTLWLPIAVVLLVILALLWFCLGGLSL